MESFHGFINSLTWLFDKMFFNPAETNIINKNYVDDVRVIKVRQVSHKRCKSVEINWRTLK